MKLKQLTPYMGIILTVSGTLVLALSALLLTSLDSNLPNLLGLGLIIAGIVTHIKVTKRQTGGK